jgi:hypothetical protein
LQVTQPQDKKVAGAGTFILKLAKDLDMDEVVMADTVVRVALCVGARVLFPSMLRASHTI